MRVLIIGGAGFIGAHLARAARNADALVSILDPAPRPDFVPGPYYCASTLDASTLKTAVERADLVFDLSGPSGARQRDSPAQLLGTSQVVEACASLRRPLLMTSSAAVYGRGPGVLREETAPAQTQAFSRQWSERARYARYAQQKRAAETLALSALGDGVTIARLFNVIGPGMSIKSRRIVPTLVDQALRQEPLTVLGDGRQRRVFAPASATAEALFQLGCCARARGEIVNVGGTMESSVLAIARRIKQLTRARGPIVRHLDEDTPLEPQARTPQLTKLRGLLGWTPQGELDTELLSAIRSAAVRPDRLGDRRCAA